MKVWFPEIEVGGGVEVFRKTLAEGLTRTGHSVEITSFPHSWQYLPSRLRFAQAPAGTDVIVAHSWWGFAARRSQAKLVVIEHGVILDPAYAPYRTPAQAVFHKTFISRFSRASYRKADAVVAVSDFTRQSIRSIFGEYPVNVIANGVNTEFFAPAVEKNARANDDGPIRLLFVGHFTRRKGADLLAPIMEALGPGYELRYTSGWRTNVETNGTPGMIPIGHLNIDQVRREYQQADILLFPTRFDGFGLPAIEAMACGVPVIASDTCAMPEIIRNGETGYLCPVDDVGAFVAAIRKLSADVEHRKEMGARARRAAESRFNGQRMTADYISLFQSLLG